MDVLILDCGKDCPGESKTTGYIDKIEILSYSHGIAQQITSDQSNQKRTSGKPNHQDITFTKYLDLASPVLVNLCNTATPIASVVFTVGQMESNTLIPYMVYTFTDALVSSVSVGGGGGGKPQETITFNYVTMKWAYTLQTDAAGKGGTAGADWDLSAVAAPKK